MYSNKERLILEYLSFREAGIPLRHLFELSAERRWDKYLTSLDSAGMVFHFIAKLRQRGDFEALPLLVQSRLRKNLRDQTERHACITSEFREFNQILQARGIQYIWLKGLTAFPDFVDDPVGRLQSDHDFLVHHKDLRRAYELFLGMGLEPKEAVSAPHADHLPALIRKSGWKWKGNLYDPEIPRAVEIHFRLCDAQQRGRTIRSLAETWQNSVRVDVGGVSVPVLSREDALTYAILHAFRHLLRSDFRLAHLYELAFFLHHSRQDETFWCAYSEKLRNCPFTHKVAATMFCLACHCFGPNTSPHASALAAQNLSPAVQLWIRSYGRKEALSSYRQSKSILFLQLDFLENRSDIVSTIVRQLLPCHLPSRTVVLSQIPEGQKMRFRRVREVCHFARRVNNRALFHAASLIAFLWRYPLWKLRLIRCQNQSRPQPSGLS